jgi:hypothetical protein
MFTNDQSICEAPPNVQFLIEWNLEFRVEQISLKLCTQNDHNVHLNIALSIDKRPTSLLIKRTVDVGWKMEVEAIVYQYGQ